MDSLVLTKQSAAHRLLVAAINMFERGDDQLATFVVASAAYSTLRELVKVKGDSFAASILREALFSDAKRRTLGLPELLPAETHLEQAIEQIAEGIRTGEIKRPEDVRLVLSKQDERALIRHQTDPYNFLKHADRDPRGSLEEGQVDALGVIFGAAAAYSHLFPVETLPREVSVFLNKHGLIDPAFATP